MNTVLDLPQMIEDLAKKLEINEPAIALRLRDLGEAVGGGPSFNKWAVSDIFKLIDPEGIRDRAQRRMVDDQGIRGLESARNSLLFAPIMITWIGIAISVDAYHSLLLERSEYAKDTFLYLWQQGFYGYGRLPGFTLSLLAAIDGILLAVIFILTLLMSRRANQITARRTHEALEIEQLHEEITDVAAEATLALAELRSQQTPVSGNQFTTAAQQLLAEIGKERQRLSDLAAKREKEFDDFKVFTTEFAKGAQNLLTTAQSSQQAYQQLTGSISSLTTLTQQSVEQQKNLLQAAREAGTRLTDLTGEQRNWGQSLRNAVDTLTTVTPQVVQVATKLEAVVNALVASQTQLLSVAADERTAQTKLLQSVSAATTNLVSTAQAVEQGHQQLTGSINSLTTLTQQSVEQQKDLLQAAREAGTRLTDLTGEQRTWGQNLRNTMDTLKIVVPQVGDVAAKLAVVAGTLVTSQTQFLSAIANERAAQTNLSRSVSLATTNLENALKEISTSSANLHAIGVDLSQLARALNAKPNIT